MIPQFPEFKKLELSDKDEVNSHIDKFPPYSDHNFVGTWSWDIRDQMQISVLNNNYVIRFIDYVTGEPFYTFLGTNQVDDTIASLLDLSIKEGLKPELKLIAEEIIEHIDVSKFIIEEDRDNFDYIYSLDEHEKLEGSKYKNKRNQLVSFLKLYPKAEAKQISLEDEHTRDELLELTKKWITNKHGEVENFEHHHETIVLKNFFKNPTLFNLVTVGVFIDGSIKAFSVNELKDNGYVVSHLIKSDTLHLGINAFLTQNTARILRSIGQKYVNYEQDLGIEGLRNSKLQLRPVTFLKKYKVAFRN